MAQRRKTKASRVNSATNRYLDQLIDELELPSDYALAERLEISTQAVYKMRGGGMMGAATAAKVAHLLGLDALQVIAETELERGSEDQFWKRVRDAAVVAALSIGAASFGVAPQPAQAAGFNNNGIVSGSAPAGLNAH